MDIFLLVCLGIGKHMNRRVVATEPVFPQSYWTSINKQEFIIHDSVTLPVQNSLSTLPTMSSIYDKPGVGWNRIDPDNYITNYCQTNEMGDVVQQEKNLQHHNSWKRITFNWWQWGMLSCLLKHKWKKFCYSMCGGWVWREQCRHSSKASKTLKRWYLWVWGN